MIKSYCQFSVFQWRRCIISSSSSFFLSSLPSSSSRDRLRCGSRWASPRSARPIANIRHYHRHTSRSLRSRRIDKSTVYRLTFTDYRLPFTENKGFRLRFLNSQKLTAKVCANRMQNQACLNYAEVQPKLNNEVVNRRQTESNQACLNCRGAKEEKPAKQD